MEEARWGSIVLCVITCMGQSVVTWYWRPSRVISDETSGASQDLHERAIRVRVGVGAGDAEVDMRYIIFKMRA